MEQLLADKFATEGVQAGCRDNLSLRCFACQLLASN